MTAPTPRAAPPRTVAAAILDQLAEQGVTTVFGLPGVHNLPFWSVDPASPGGRVEIVGTRHEATAVFAADGLARTSGGVGVALVTSGPGAANAVAAFGEAAAAGSPVVVIASDVPERLRHPDGFRGLLHESTDQGGLFAPLAAMRPARLPRVLQPRDAQAAVAAAAQAVEAARCSPAGPVYLGIPADVLAAPAPDVTGSAPSAAGPVLPDPAEIDAAVTLLTEADDVVVWVGGGVVAEGRDTEDAVVALAARLGAPIVTTYAARGLLAPGHPLLVDAPPHEPEVADLIAGADLLLALGTDFDGMTTRNWTMPVPPRLVSIGLDFPRMQRTFPPDVAVVADVGPAADALTVRLSSRQPWGDAVFLVGPNLRRRLHADPVTADAITFVDAVDQEWPQRGAVVCDMAVAGYWVGGYARMERTRRLAYPVGWGTLGFGLPAAIGAAAAGQGPVLAVVGDGGLAMGLGELATLVQQRLDVTVLLVDDGGYGMLRYDQQRAGLPERGTDLDGPDWLGLAASFGLPAELAPDAGPGLAAALHRAAHGGGPRLVVVRAALTPPRTTSPRWRDPE